MFNNCFRKDMCNRRNCPERPIYEPEVTECTVREFYHDVPHIIPVHNHIINRHIYNHTYQTEYTCSEENQVINKDSCGFQGYNN